MFCVVGCCRRRRRPRTNERPFGRTERQSRCRPDTGEGDAGGGLSRSRVACERPCARTGHQSASCHVYACTDIYELSGCSLLAAEPGSASAVDVLNYVEEKRVRRIRRRRQRRRNRRKALHARCARRSAFGVHNIWNMSCSGHAKLAIRGFGFCTKSDHDARDAHTQIYNSIAQHQRHNIQ